MPIVKVRGKSGTETLKQFGPVSASSIKLKTTPDVEVDAHMMALGQSGGNLGFSRSFDGGATWGTFVPVFTGTAGGITAAVGAYGNMVFLRQYRKWNPSNTTSSQICRSSDLGLNRTTPSTFDSGAYEDIHWSYESGRFVAIGLDATGGDVSPARSLRRALSDNEGSTWSYANNGTAYRPQEILYTVDNEWVVTERYGRAWDSTNNGSSFSSFFSDTSRSLSGMGWNHVGVYATGTFVATVQSFQNFYMRNWSSVAGGGSDRAIRAVSVHPYSVAPFTVNSGVWVSVGWSLPSPSTGVVERSTNDASSWSTVSGTYPQLYSVWMDPISRTNTNSALCLIGGNSYIGRSTNSGGSFTTTSSHPFDGPVYKFLDIPQDMKSDQLFLTDLPITKYKSSLRTVGGSTFAKEA